MFDVIFLFTGHKVDPQMVTKHKESPSWYKFDSFTALVIWCSLKTRRVPLPPLQYHLQNGKCWVKPLFELKEAHRKRHKRHNGSKVLKSKQQLNLLKMKSHFGINASDEDVQMDAEESEEADEGDQEQSDGDVIELDETMCLVQKILMLKQ